MAIVYAGVQWLANATMRDTIHVSVTLAGAPTGVTGGDIHIAGGIRPVSFGLKRVNDILYRAEVVCGMVGRCTAVPVTVVMWDTGGPVVYGLPLTLTVVECGEPYLPDTGEFVREMLKTGWDETYHRLPTIVLQSEEKALSMMDLKHIHITLAAKKTQTKARGCGRYKDTRYPLEIIVRSEGNPNSKVLARDGMAEVQRIIETNWNFLPNPWVDYIEFEDDGVDLSYQAAGRYEWRWNISLVGKLRGRAGTPDRPDV